MSYKDILRKQIRELEEKIAVAGNEKRELEIQLNKLKLSEFEEELREDNKQILLNG